MWRCSHLLLSAVLWPVQHRRWWCTHGTQPQTRRTSGLRSHDGTDRQTDRRKIKCSIDHVIGCARHRRSQGVHVWVHVHPPGRIKNFWGQIYWGKLYLHPQAESAPPARAIIEFCWGNWEDLDGGSGNLGSLISLCFEGMTTKKVVTFFGEEKFTPRENHGRPIPLPPSSCLSNSGYKTFSA